jgi:hypothetical protein
MRELTTTELSLVSGAGDDCGGGSDSGSGNDFGGIQDTDNLGDDLINIYEGVVQAVSHVIERVADALRG